MFSMGCIGSSGVGAKRAGDCTRSAFRRRKLLVFAALPFHLATFVRRQIQVALSAITQALLALAAVFVPLPAVAFQRLLFLGAE
jgi:hypothetical protein